MKLKLIIPLLALLLLVGGAYAIEGCCELTADGAYCRQVDQEQCAEGASFVPTSCGQTAFCKVGCCYTADEGRCYRNTPKARCADEGATWNPDPLCEISQCKKGCCVLGDQAAYITEVQCKHLSELYPEVEMQFDSDSKSESECIASVKSMDLGCCVADDGCQFTTMGACPTASTEPLAANETRETGFFKGMLCSNDKLSCGCSKQFTTGCVGEDLYWFDSCGNRENIYDTDKAESFNNGYVLEEADSCYASGPGDRNCGNCDYTRGTLCGKDTGKVMPVGEFTCVDVNCRSTFEDEDGYSPNADGKLKDNGESWCVYDSMPGFARDWVGSRHYRFMCINGEEIVDECKDFREEMCIQGIASAEAFDNIPAMRDKFGDEEYVEAACRDNRWEECDACNKIGEEVVEKNGYVPDSIDEQRQKCCANEYMRDCYWLPVTLGDVKGEEGMCVPQVPPGLKFWADSTTQASEAKASSSEAEQVCSKANRECSVKYKQDGLARAGGFVRAVGYIFAVPTRKGWQVINNKQCTSREWLVAGSIACKAQGDCGAYYNVLGKLTMDGYFNTLSDEQGFGINVAKLKQSDIDDWEEKVTKAKKPGFWDNPSQAMAVIVGPLNAIGGGIWGGVAGRSRGEGSFFSNFMMNSMPFVSMFSGLGKGKQFGQAYSFAYPMQQLGGMFGGLKMKEGARLNPGDVVTDAVIDNLVEGGFSIGNMKPDNVLKLGGEELENSIISSEGFVDFAGDRLTMETDVGSLLNDYISEKPSAVQSIIDDNPVFSKQFSGVDKLKDSGIINNKGVVKSQGVAKFGTVVNAYLWVNTILNIVNVAATKEKSVTYMAECKPWQPPSGGKDCEVCNEGPRPCSEYKCRSLGASCKLINEGTSDEKCVATDVNDVNSPIIAPMSYAMLPYTYEEETYKGHPGFTLNEKVPPFQRVTLGIMTDEPAQCRYDVEPGKKFEQKPHVFGSTLYLYNQTIDLVMPSELASPNVTAQNGGEYTMYIRCKDANGNENERDYFIRFIVDDTPDMTAPVVLYTTLQNNGYLKHGTEEAAFSVYVDEPSGCKWSKRDIEFEQMENDFSCKDEMFGQSSMFFGSYECSTVLTDLKATENRFYIRCKDKPHAPENERIVNEESFEFTLKGTNALNITSSGPSGTLYTNEATLTAETEGGAEGGKADCAFSTADAAFEDMIAFLETGAGKHSQPFNDLPEGDYTYHVACRDVAANEDTVDITFTIDVDEYSPELLSVYVDTFFGLTIELDEKAECEYLNVEDFELGEGSPFTSSSEGKVHEATPPSDYDTLHVKCMDVFNNTASYTIHI